MNRPVREYPDTGRHDDKKSYFLKRKREPHGEGIQFGPFAWFEKRSHIIIGKNTDATITYLCHNTPPER